MHLTKVTEDRVWERVLELLSTQGRLSRFQRLPRHELNATLKLYGHQAVEDLQNVFKLASSSDPDAEVLRFLTKISEGRQMAMLSSLIGSMRCWVETESPIQSVRSRWKIANS